MVTWSFLPFAVNVMLNLSIISEEIKLRMFQFNITHDSVFTKDRLFKASIIQDDKCYFFKENPETLLHLLFHCPLKVPLSNDFRELENFCWRFATVELISTHFRSDWILMAKTSNFPTELVKNFIRLGREVLRHIQAWKHFPSFELHGWLSVVVQIVLSLLQTLEFRWRDFLEVASLLLLLNLDFLLTKGNHSMYKIYRLQELVVWDLHRTVWYANWKKK